MSINSVTKPLVVFAVAAAAGALMLIGLLLHTDLSPKVMTSGRASIGGPFTLVTTNGQSVNDQTYRGKWVLIYFGYTYCPDACPTALNNISVALEKLGASASNLQPIFVTVDPQRDTREVMTEYLKSFDSRILGLTGTKEQIDNVTKEFHLYVSREKSDSDGDSYLVSHSSYIYLMDAHGTFANVIQGAATGDEIVSWVRKEMAHAGR
jgi:protein SCO1/2